MTTSNKTEILIELKDLLFKRSSGEITQEEFNQKQSALYLKIIDVDYEDEDKETNNIVSPEIKNKKQDKALLLIVCITALFIGSFGYFIIGNKNQRFNLEKPMPKLRPPADSNKFSEENLKSLGLSIKPNISDAPKQNGGDLNDVSEKLAAKLEKNPSNGDGWLLLARSYTQLHKTKEAANAFSKADSLIQLDAQSYADWADFVVNINDNKWNSEAEKIVKKALSRDPKNIKALALAGAESFERKDYKESISWFKKMKEFSIPDSIDQKLAEANIIEAEKFLTKK